ncbi:MAG: outer membrane beta-barrel protein [Xanthobacteraceae bacterium]|nr:outer membrane beta-barrel protein [Xanthobacteraceae bacterium]
MRRWVMATVFAAAAHGAWAADLPDLSDLPVLRGGITDGLSRSSVNWQGAYVGGQVGYTSANMDFSNATSSLASQMLQNSILQSIISEWTVMGKSSPTSTSFGGFVGYNAQWDDAVLGIEANYSHFSGLKGVSAGSVGPLSVTPAGETPPPNHTYVYHVAMNGSATAQVTDAMTFRGRAGYAVGNFLPYVFGGIAVGRVNYSRNVALDDTIYDWLTTTTVVNQTPVTNTTFAGSSTQTPLSAADSGTAYAYGYTAGFGLETMLWGGLFARGEYEYIKFTSIKNIGITTNTVRGGLGYKF